MTDLRITRLANLLVNYSMELQPRDELIIRCSPLGDELNLAVYKAALLAGANPVMWSTAPGQDEIFFQYASEDQLDYVSPLNRLMIEQSKAILDIDANHNPHELSAVKPERLARRRKARSHLLKTMLERMGTRDLKWCYTVYPTHASAQEADMSLSDYQEFVFRAGMLDMEDPAAEWRKQAARMQQWTAWLAGKHEVAIQGNDVDLTMRITGRTFAAASGQENFPDGEIYTSPVEDSVNGWVRFSYPAIFAGQEVQDIELRFENGKVVSEKAAKGQDLLTAQLDVDAGARYLGELGIGTNYAIRRFTKDMLFDEKIGGTIHLAVGAGFPELGSQNDSALHWDMLCDMADSEMRADGALFYKNGQFVI